MNPDALRISFRDSHGLHTVSTRSDATRVEQGGIVANFRIETEQGATIVRSSVANRSSEPIKLVDARIEIATGLRPNAPARFFKHGYQSWSASGPADAGSRSNSGDEAHFLVRLNHRSELVRPPGIDEQSSSEIFTIIESEGATDRVLAGFVGAAHQLTTLCVESPSRVIARALFDGAALNPGEEREVEPLMMISSNQSAATLAARWASTLGRGMNARTRASYQRGWCSWYHYFHEITEDALLANLRSLKEMRGDFPVGVVQLDDGFQSALGDWDTTNAKFPSGLKAIATQICDAGFKAGLWTAPFLAARDSRIMREHPDWFIRYENGPLRAAYNTNWTTDSDAFAYALDPSHPGFTEHLRRLFSRIVHDLGYDYLKLDFLYAGAAEGARYDSRMTRAEALRHGLDTIRDAAGDRVFILGCGCPLAPAVGIVDGMRIGPDVAPYWGSHAAHAGAPGTAQAIDAIIARSFMHRRLWLNDPDCLMLRAKHTKLTSGERMSLAATIAASGGMLLISDDMSLLDAEAAQTFQVFGKIGAEVDADSADEPALDADLMRRSEIKILSKSMRDGALHLILNTADSPRDADLAKLLACGSATTIGADGSESDAPLSVLLQPHESRLIRARVKTEVR